jgi:glycosyltransferase involved in cell wall biosynthesis
MQKIFATSSSSFWAEISINLLILEIFHTMNNDTKRKVFAFIDWYLPGYRAGGGQRAFANMVAWLREDFDFYIITRNTDFLESEPYMNVKTDTWNELAKGENVYYATENRVGFSLFAKLFKEVNPDYVYVNGIYSPKFSIFPLIFLRWKRFKGRLVLGTYGMLAPTAIQIKQGKKKLFLQIARALGLYRNITFHATSEHEERDIKAVFGANWKIKYAPHLPVKEFPDFKEIEKIPGELRLISIARISPEKNTLFALECLSTINAGKVIFDLYGPLYDREYWEVCQEVIDQLPKNVEVTYRGIAAGNEVMELLTEYHCLFMPSRGENFGYAILESFIAGRPVLISNQTPWKELEKKNCGFDLPLEPKEAFSKLITNMSGLSQKEFNEMCRGAQLRAKEFVDNPDLRVMNSSLFI